VIALVLAHAGLDISLDLELGTPGADRGAVHHRGGDRLVVTAPADRAALEWALALADRTVVLSVGPPEAENVMTWALGRGAMGAVRIWEEAIEKMDLPAMARVIEAAVGRITPDVIVAGERGLAGATGALPALVAARLGWPCVDGAHRLTREASLIVAERRLRGDAARREHETWSLADIGLTAETVRAAVRLRLGGIDWPRPRPRRTAAASTAAPARSAAERLRQLVAGGPAATRSAGPAPPASRLLEGDPGTIADRIVAFLEQQRFV
jgi:electron transfer flavoprotein beta subunit